MKVIHLFLKSLGGTIIFLSLLFISAGRINYWQGWLYATVNLILVVINSFALINNNELAEERSKSGIGAKTWDKMIIGFSAITLVIVYVVAGLDSGRYHWSPKLHWSLHLLGIVLLMSGEVFFFFAQRQNKFFSSVMRIQSDRGHSVCETGIYKIIRHPAYLGTIITAIGIPLILGSFWSFIPSFVSIILTFIRTCLEDKTLINELNGYPDYTHKTPYRLIPGIW